MRYRLVLDTNVLVSAALKPDSVPGRLVAEALRNHVVLSSPQTLSEFWVVLQRPKFDRLLSLAVRRTSFATFEAALVPVEVSASVRDCRDAMDNKFLELALSGGADFIVSGDDDLLSLAPWRGVRM